MPWPSVAANVWAMDLSPTHPRHPRCTRKTRAVVEEDLSFFSAISASAKTHQYMYIYIYNAIIYVYIPTLCIYIYNIYIYIPSIAWIISKSNLNSVTGEIYSQSHKKKHSHPKSSDSPRYLPSFKPFSACSRSRWPCSRDDPKNWASNPQDGGLSRAIALKETPKKKVAEKPW